MCGIAGILLRGGRTDARLLAAVESMSSALAHRGPDDNGVWLDEEAGIALGHRRLSIVDLSPNGHQPKASASGAWMVTYNGEVFNCDELRPALARRGHRFQGHSDTEVMLAAFDEHGVERALPLLSGFFAFGAWDRRNRRLHLVRDRLGKKPLYIALTREALLFASELKGLLAFPGFEPEVDPEALASVISYGYVGEHQCVWKGVFRLPPGSLLTLGADELVGASAETLRRRVRPWWSLADVAARGQREPLQLGHAELLIELDATLGLAVRQRMIADVPIGSFLSGGIDSTLVTALMQSQSRTPVRTFTMAFRERGYDESGHAEAIARHLGTEHIAMTVTPAEAQRAIPELPRVWDEPFADESQVPTLLLCRMARDHIKVAMTGDGGDECFGGYVKHFTASQVSRLMTMPLAARKAAAAILTGVGASSWDRFAHRLPGGSRIGGGITGAKLHKLARLITAASEHELYDRFLNAAPAPLLLAPAVGADEPEPAVPALADIASRFMYRDMCGYLPADILVKADRASMASQIELRSPLLDHAVVEFAWRLPVAANVSAGQGKRLLRQLLTRYVPPALFERPKQGFNVPVGTWLSGPLRDWAEHLIDERRIEGEGLFDAAEVRACWRDHLSGRRDRFRELWAVLMIEAWLDVQREARQVRRLLTGPPVGARSGVQRGGTEPALVS